MTVKIRLTVPSTIWRTIVVDWGIQLQPHHQHHSLGSFFRRRIDAPNRRPQPDRQSHAGNWATAAPSGGRSVLDEPVVASLLLLLLFRFSEPLERGMMLQIYHHQHQRSSACQTPSLPKTRDAAIRRSSVRSTRIEVVRRLKNSFLTESERK